MRKRRVQKEARTFMGGADVQWGHKYIRVPGMGTGRRCIEEALVFHGPRTKPICLQGGRNTSADSRQVRVREERQRIHVDRCKGLETDDTSSCRRKQFPAGDQSSQRNNHRWPENTLEHICPGSQGPVEAHKSKYKLPVL